MTTKPMGGGDKGLSGRTTKKLTIFSRLPLGRTDHKFSLYINYYMGMELFMEWKRKAFNWRTFSKSANESPGNRCKLVNESPQRTFKSANGITESRSKSINRLLDSLLPNQK